jgi:uncharacterized membrane protein
MAFCRQCGKQHGDDAGFCPSCGRSTSPQQQTTQNEKGQGGRSGGNYTPQNENNNRNNKSYNPENDILFGILAYIGILVFISIFCAKESKSVKYHARQGFTLLAFGFCSYVVFGIFRLVFVRLVHFWWLALPFSLIYAALGILFFILMLIGIINAANKAEKPLPIIGNIKIKPLDDLFELMYKQ